MPRYTPRNNFRGALPYLPPSTPCIREKRNLPTKRVLYRFNHRPLPYDFFSLNQQVSSLIHVLKIKKKEKVDRFHVFLYLRNISNIDYFSLSPTVPIIFNIHWYSNYFYDTTNNTWSFSCLLPLNQLLSLNALSLEYTYDFLSNHSYVITGITFEYNDIRKNCVFTFPKLMKIQPHNRPWMQNPRFLANITNIIIGAITVPSIFTKRKNGGLARALASLVDDGANLFARVYEASVRVRGE